MPTGASVGAAVTQVHDALEQGDSIAVKHLLGQFIHRIEISTDWQAHPTYLIPKTPIPEPHATRGSGTPVRICEPNVEVAGIEPASAGAEPVLLRAQSAVAFLSPGDHADESPSRAQSLLVSHQLRDRAFSQWPPRRRQHPGRRHSRADAVAPRLRRRGRAGSALCWQILVCDEVYEITSPSRPASPASTSDVEACHPLVVCRLLPDRAVEPDPGYSSQRGRRLDVFPIRSDPNG